MTETTAAERARPRTFPNATPRPEGELAALERIWDRPRGIHAITAVNNSIIGLLYIGTAFLFFLLAGILALVMRTQLAQPNAEIVGHTLYNQLFTMHGTVMMFLFAVPLVEAVSVLLLPNMQAARDLPFPRLSAYAFWAYAVGGLAFFSSLFFGLAPMGGWFMYPPLTSEKFSPGINADFWLLGIGFIEISAIAGAIEIIVGILKTRAPGQSLDKLPVYSWAMLVFAFMIVFAFPAVIVATLLLELERAFDWPFFIAERGGDPLLWQHLFWFFGHPEVYVIFIPAAGMVSMAIVPTILPSSATGSSCWRCWRPASVVRAVGAPHVRDRVAADVLSFLRREHGGGDPERHPGVRVDRDDRERPAAARRAELLHPRLPVHLHARRIDRRDGRHGPLRLAGA